MDDSDVCPPTYLQQRLASLPSSRQPLPSWPLSDLETLLDGLDDGMVVLHRVFAQESEGALAEALLDAASALLRCREDLVLALQARRKRDGRLARSLTAVPAPRDLHQDGS